MEYQTAYEALCRELGESRKMVLSTSLDNLVTSRMMSVVVMERTAVFPDGQDAPEIRAAEGQRERRSLRGQHSNSGTLIERWVYLDGVPHLEAFDVVNRRHSLTRYVGE